MKAETTLKLSTGRTVHVVIDYADQKITLRYPPTPEEEAEGETLAREWAVEQLVKEKVKIKNPLEMMLQYTRTPRPYDPELGLFGERRGLPKAKGGNK